MLDGGALTTQDFTSLVDALRHVEQRVGDAERVEQLAALERVKAAAAAAQARVTADFVESQAQLAEQWRERQRACSAAGDFEAWVVARDQARQATFEPDDAAHTGAATGGRRARRRETVSGVAAQVALARHESPARGTRHVSLALTLTREMPHTFAALESGVISEWRAMIIVRETAELDADQRSSVDAEVCGALGEGLGSLGDRELARRVRAVAYRIDPASVMARSTRAQADRRVTIRPAPDTMAYVTALLPVAQAVAAHAALTSAADAARAAGDDRSKGQVMADELVTRVTGQEHAEAVPIEVQLVMTDRTLIAGDDVPAQLPGYGTVPAAWARRLLNPPEADSTDEQSQARVWLRRLYTDPGGADLVAMDSTRRIFDGGLRRFVVARDGATCRTPWCDAPVRHVDHVRDHAQGGPTSADNGQGLCVRCNHTKQLPGWRAASGPAPPSRPAGHLVITTTPTGHRCSSLAPPLIPGAPPDPRGPLERRLGHLLAA